jgi:hypothetical protein
MSKYPQNRISGIATSQSGQGGIACTTVKLIQVFNISTVKDKNETQIIRFIVLHFVVVNYLRRNIGSFTRKKNVRTITLRNVLLGATRPTSRNPADG